MEEASVQDGAGEASTDIPFPATRLRLKPGRNLTRSLYRCYCDKKPPSVLLRGLPSGQNCYQNATEVEPICYFVDGMHAQSSGKNERVMILLGITHSPLRITHDG